MSGRVKNKISVLAGEHGLTTFTAILALISTIIGGGIVGMPYSMLHFGFPLAIVFNVLAVMVTIASGTMYLAIKDTIPDRPESLYEIGYMLLRRKSIFIIATITSILSFGLMMIYFIVFGDTAAQLIGAVIGEDYNESPYSSRWLYVIVLAGVLIPVILQKDLAELDWLGWTLFIAILLFIIVNLIQLCFAPNFVRVKAGTDFWAPAGPLQLIQAVSITLVAYGY